MESEDYPTLTKVPPPDTDLPEINFESSNLNPVDLQFGLAQLPDTTLRVKKGGRNHPESKFETRYTGLAAAYEFGKELTGQEFDYSKMVVTNLESDLLMSIDREKNYEPEHVQPWMDTYHFYGEIVKAGVEGHQTILFESFNTVPENALRFHEDFPFYREFHEKTDISSFEAAEILELDESDDYNIKLDPEYSNPVKPREAARDLEAVDGEFSLEARIDFSNRIEVKMHGKRVYDPQIYGILDTSVERFKDELEFDNSLDLTEDLPLS